MKPKPNPDHRIGGVLHTYLKFDPQKFPSPNQGPPDLVSPLMNHLMAYGSMRELTDEELARAIRIDPSQFKNFGPSLDMVQAMLEERKRKILERYETGRVQVRAKKRFHKTAKSGPQPEGREGADFHDAVQHEQIYVLERLWFNQHDDNSRMAQQLMVLIDQLGDKYQIDELSANYRFTGHESMTIPLALEIKEELDKIEELLNQLEQARENAQIAILDLDQLTEFMDSETMQSLEEMQRSIENYVREMAERQGLTRENGKFQLTPQAYRIFQNKLLGRIFGELKSSRSGRHTTDVPGDGAVELQQTKPYEFGDSITHMDIPQTFVNAMLRSGARLPLQLKTEDIEIHTTRNSPKCATVVLMDMSGSMRYDGQYMNVKRMALAMDGLIRTEYPGDVVHFVEMYTFGKVRKQGEIVDLMPKPVTLHDPWVQLKVDMGDPDVSEHLVHQHFTNIQHALKLARQLLATQNTPNRQILLITDGLPTAHFEDSTLYMLYPPHPRTEEMTMREGMLCAQEEITINMFLVPSWSQSEEDIRFAYRLCEATCGRVFFTAGSDLDRFVVWDYLKRKREIL